MTYHYVLVLKIHLGGHSYGEFESNGTVEIEPGTTRNQVYEEARYAVLENARERGVTGSATTVFWSLEPDALGGDR